MTDINQPVDFLSNEEKAKKLPEMLNVLSILTFVGCGLFALTSVWGYFSAPKSYEEAQRLQSQMENVPAFAKSLMGGNMVEIARKSLENRLPILLLGLVGYALCLYGAIQMRQKKKAGFTIYVIGEILPLVTSFIFIGAAAFGGLSFAFALLFPAVFIILYATQLKHMA
jgi:hypothetical protein